MADLVVTLLGPRSLWHQGKGLWTDLQIEFRVGGGLGRAHRTKLVAKALFWLARVTFLVLVAWGVVVTGSRLAFGGWRSQLSILAFQCTQQLSPTDSRCGALVSDPASGQVVYCVYAEDRSRILYLAQPRLSLGPDTVGLAERWVHCPDAPLINRTRSKSVEVSYYHPDHGHARATSTLTGTPAFCLQHLMETTERSCQSVF